MKYKLGDIKGSFFFLKKIKNMSYVLALCNGFAQSSPSHHLLGSPASTSVSSPLTSVPNSKLLAMGTLAFAPKPHSMRP